jgi:putative peptidoglycan lipid II flippase
VLLPEMTSRIATGDEEGALHAQNRAMEFTLLLSIPCFVAFLVIPDLIMLALFGRGAFTAADAAAAAATLAAYTIGLFPFVLLRSVSSTFLARGDTATPVKALLISVVINVGCKVLLMGRFAQVGLALATSIGIWVNFILLTWFARRRNLIDIDDRFRRSLWRFALAGFVLAVALFIGYDYFTVLFVGLPRLRALATLSALTLVGGIVYGGAIALLFGRRWLAAFGRRDGRSKPALEETIA